MSLSKCAWPALLALTLITALPARAHQRVDPLDLAPTAPAAGATSESISGTVRELVVDDHVAGMTVRHVLVVPADGGAATTVRGSSVASLRDGAEVTVIGRRNGDALFVESSRVTKQASSIAASVEDRAEGRLMLLHSDDFETGKTRYHYEVHADDGRVTGLRLHILPESLQSGMKISVSGRRDPVSGDLEPTRIDIHALADATGDKGTSTVVAAKAAVTHSVLVTLIKFSDTGADPMSAAIAQQVMTTNTGSVANYFREASFGQHTLNVTVTPWVNTTLATPTACGSTQWSQIQQAGDAAAKAAGYTASYEYHVYIFPHLASCAWAGLAYIGNPKWAFINGAGAVTTNVIAHEMGHNFGLLHAGSRDCAAAVIGGTCSIAEYGDVFNTMGQGNSMHYAASQKLLLGWIPSASVETHASGSAIYTISPLELGSGTTYAVKVPVATQRTYWLEYRQPVGFDAKLSAYPSNGVQVRLAAPFESTCSGCADDTQLLDLTPGTGAFADGTLLVGQTFKDPTYGTSFSVLSSTATGVTVQVTSGGSVPTVTPTTTTLATSANPASAGATITFTATVSGAAPIGAVAFKSNGAALAGCNAVALTGTGNARAASCSTSALGAGSYSVVATYAGSSTNGASTSNAIAQSVTAAPPPVTPPGALVNGSFEAPSVGSGYRYAPAATGIGWTFDSKSGVQGNGSAWGATAPNGTQTAFIQGAGAITQAVSLPAGSYTLTFQSARRSWAIPAGAVQPVRVTVDGVQIGPNVVPPGTSFSAVAIPFSIPASGTHVLGFAGTDASGDKSTFIDGVIITSSAPPASLANGSFETPAVGNGYRYNPTAAGIGWTFGTGAGIQGNGSAWGAAAAPGGTQTAFLQGAGTISQGITLAPGTYALTFRVARRGFAIPAGAVQPVRVSVDGREISTITPASTAFTPVSIQFAVVDQGIHTIAFVGTDAAGDKSTFIDAISLAPASATAQPVDSSVAPPGVGAGSGYGPSRLQR